MNTIGYFYKKKGAYPARIYAFLLREFPPRNRRAFGLETAEPIARREATAEEITHEFTDTRARYYQYEDWDLLIRDERTVGTSEAFIQRIEALRDSGRFPLTQVSPTEYALRKGEAALNAILKR